DSLHDSERAISGYDEILISLENSSLDSLRLVAEFERIHLLNRVGERAELLASFGSATKLARKINDHAKLSFILSLRAFVYTQLGFVEQAKEILEEAYASALKIKAPDERNLQLGYHSAVHSHTTEHSDAKISDLTRAYQYFMDVRPTSPKYRSAQITGNSYYASAFMENDELDSAMHYLTTSTSFIDPNDALTDDYYAILNFAKLHLLREDYAMSKKWFEYALAYAKNENNEYCQGVIYYHLYNTEFAMGESQQANQYLQQYASLKETLDNTQIKSISLVEEALTDQRQNIVASDSSRETGIVAIFTVIAFLSCVSAVWLFKQQSQPATTHNQNTLTFMDRGCTPTADAPQSLSAVILKEITPERPNDHKEETYNEPNEVSIEKIKELNHLVKTNDPSFMVKFHEAFPGFARTVSSYADPALNNPEIEICACTKLNFSTKEIALYRNYTLRSVENRKYRIRKKLKLGSEVDFVVWIA